MSFTVEKRNCSWLLECDDGITRGIISCYGIDFDDPYVKYSDMDLNYLNPLIQNLTNPNSSCILIWSEADDRGEDMAKEIERVFNNAGARTRVIVAPSKEVFNGWFNEHDKFIETIRKYNRSTTMCSKHDEYQSQWIHSVLQQKEEPTDAWTIQKLSKDGIVLEVFGSSWHEFLERNFKRVQKLSNMNVRP